MTLEIRDWRFQFLYYSRGSLFETKYWLNRALVRDLMPASEVQNYTSRLTDLARRLNTFTGNLKSQRRGDKGKSNAISESGVAYTIDATDDMPEDLFSDAYLQWLQSLPPEPEIGKP